MKSPHKPSPLNLVPAAPNPAPETIKSIRIRVTDAEIAKKMGEIEEKILALNARMKGIEQGREDVMRKWFESVAPEARGIAQERADLERQYDSLQMEAVEMGKSECYIWIEHGVISQSMAPDGGGVQ